MQFDTKKIREKLILSQSEFSKKTGISYGTIQKWEQCKNEQGLIYQRKLLQFCKRHKINIENVSRETKGE